MKYQDNILIFLCYYKYGDYMLDLCFEIIEKCPNECMFCSSNSCINKNKIISFEKFKEVIDKLHTKYGIKELSLSGGEPLLHPNIYEMIKYAKDKGIKVVLFTSGIKLYNTMPKEEVDYYINEMNTKLKEVMLIEPDNIFLINKIKSFYMSFITPKIYSPITREEFKILEEIRLNKIVFDFQGYEYETDTELMGRTSNMHTYLLDSLLNASRSNIDIDVHFVPMKPNYKEIKDILELLEIAHIPNISILKFVPQGRGRINRDKLELTDEELKQFIDSLNKYKNIYSGNIRVSVPMQDEITHKCSAGLSKLDIKFDGTILPCPAFKEITTEEAKKYGIKLYTIDEIDNIILIDITRRTPLCQKVYKK